MDLQNIGTKSGKHDLLVHNGSVRNIDNNRFLRSCSKSKLELESNLSEILPVNCMVIRITIPV